MTKLIHMYENPDKSMKSGHKNTVQVIRPSALNDPCKSQGQTLTLVFKVLVSKVI